MAITIIPDLIAPHEYEEDDRTGTLVRAFRVDGLTPGSDIANKAIQAKSNGIAIPTAGEPHPTMAEFVVRKVNIRPVTQSLTAMRIVIFYAKVRRRLLNLVINGVSVNTPTERDASGAVMVIGYKGPSTGANVSVDPSTPFPTPGSDSAYKYSYFKTTLPIPEQTLEITYMENGSPQEKIDKYQGFLNSKPWQGGKAREWFCEMIGGPIESPIPRNLADLADQRVVTGDALFDWIVTYKFRRRRLPPIGLGLDPLGLYVDPRIGKPPNDIDPTCGGSSKSYLKQGPGSKGNGWLYPKIFGIADFNDLNLVSAVVPAKTP